MMNENNQWRLIVSSPHNGAWNMAVDEAILESVSTRSNQPTLRLYAWYPFCLSLGHAQSVQEVDLPFINKAGWGLVRRPTGGRAILHADELTYSICAPLSDPHIQGGVIESYRNISACLLLALEKVGVIADSKPKDVEQKHLAKDPICFQYPSDYEITFGGKKLIGSAQARRAEGLLQHGSIPLFGDLTRIIAALNFDSDLQRTSASEKLKERAVTLEEAAGRRVSWHDLAQALVSAFEEKFQIRFKRADISDAEFHEAEIFMASKFANTDWTNKT
jgi:lipoate-protein ligase A